MRPIELNKDDVTSFTVDGTVLKTTFDVAAAKKGLKQFGPIILETALKKLKTKLEDDPVMILKPNEIQRIVFLCKERVSS